MKYYKEYKSNKTLEEAEELYNKRIFDALDIYNKYKDKFIKRNCFCCGSNKSVQQEKFKDSYDVSKCLRCGSYFVDPVPPDYALKEYYCKGSCNIMADFIYRNRSVSDNHSFIWDNKVLYVNKIITKLFINKKHIKILEVGCGSGGFLSKLNKYLETNYPNKTFELTGIDVDSNAVSNVVDKDLNILESSVEEFVYYTVKKYDVIVSFELLEHLVDPLGECKRLKNLLVDDGLLIFSTPNSDGLLLRLYDYNNSQPFAHSIFPPMHLNAFSFSNIKLFGFCADYNVYDVETPGNLDLSKINILDAFNKKMFLNEHKRIDKDEVKDMLQNILVKSLASTYMIGTFVKNNNHV